MEFSNFPATSAFNWLLKYYYQRLEEVYEKNGKD